MFLFIRNSEENKPLGKLTCRWEGNFNLDYAKIESEPVKWINLLKPTGYVMHQQFNIQQLYTAPTLYCICVLYLSENKQRLVTLTS
jgi:hypothetical protein